MRTSRLVQILWSLVGGVGFAGCASSGTEPHAMTAGQHEATAAAEERTAAQHQAQYDPSRVEQPERCVPYDGEDCDVRWQSKQNPTDNHRKDAEQHHKLADKHRAGSQALREAEQRFCAGIPEADRDLSPFYHGEDIASVDAVRKPPTSRLGYESNFRASEVQPIYKESLGPGSFLGARITFRAVPGMTGEWLQRVVDCRLARNAVVGPDPATSYCPLAVPHVAAGVVSTRGGFAVDVTSDNDDGVREILKRARTLGPTGPTIEN